VVLGLFSALSSVPSRDTEYSEYMRFERVYGEFLAAAAKFKAKHGSNAAVPVSDNIDMLAAYSPKFLNAL